ncbi:MAG: hypothetical protein B0D91_13350 [Oceanospirillales bacterium LUC14_002_19_P2]|nr:MAG: hypothetical protein B0D91_13350 [Oceanospirillales bacterium LUC14_002_19_P2]
MTEEQEERMLHDVLQLYLSNKGVDDQIAMLGRRIIDLTTAVHAARLELSSGTGRLVVEINLTESDVTLRIASH